MNVAKMHESKLAQPPRVKFWIIDHYLYYGRDAENNPIRVHRSRTCFDNFKAARAVFDVINPEGPGSYYLARIYLRLNGESCETILQSIVSQDCKGEGAPN